MKTLRPTARGWVLIFVCSLWMPLAASATDFTIPRKNTAIPCGPCFGYYPTCWREFPRACATCPPVQMPSMPVPVAIPVEVEPRKKVPPKEGDDLKKPTESEKLPVPRPTSQSRVP